MSTYSLIVFRIFVASAGRFYFILDSTGWTRRKYSFVRFAIYFNQAAALFCYCLLCFGFHLTCLYFHMTL